VPTPQLDGIPVLPTAPIQIRHPHDWEAFYFKLIVAIGAGIGLPAIEIARSSLKDDRIVFYISLISVYLLIAITLAPFFQKHGFPSRILGIVTFPILAISLCLLNFYFLKWRLDSTYIAIWGGAIIGGLILWFFFDLVNQKVYLKWLLHPYL
jgi:hypothetical protein